MDTQKDKSQNQYLSTTVLKSVEILNMLGTRNMSAAEIGSALCINKSTVHRLLATLEYARYIERVGDTRAYRIGIKLVELCSVRLNDIEIKTEAKPFLRELVDGIRQPVHLGIYSMGNAVYIDKIDVASSMRLYSAIGKTIPVHCSAISKALIMNQSDEEIRAILDKYGMPGFTPFTLSTPDALLAQIHEARAKGYTLDNGEHEENVLCLAVPVYDYRNDIIAAISTAAFKQNVVNQADLIRMLKETAKKISSRLGYLSTPTP